MYRLATLHNVSQIDGWTDGQTNGQTDNIIMPIGTVLLKTAKMMPHHC